MKTWNTKNACAGLLVALLCAVTFIGGAGCKKIGSAGSLNVNVSPSSAAVVVTGPGNFSQTFTGSKLLSGLAPGDYTATGTLIGYTNTVSQINVVNNGVSFLSFLLDPEVPPNSTEGALNVNITPSSATVVVTGPGDFTQTFTGSKLLTGLAPGQYTATGTATGFNLAAAQINVVTGQTSYLSLALHETPTDTVGYLNINISPSTASVVVTGPADFTQAFNGSKLLTGLEPGDYTATGTAAGYNLASNQINVVAGQVSYISFSLEPVPEPVSNVGALNINVSPSSATVVVTGPENFSQTFTGSKLLTGLAPGQYTATGTATGYSLAASQINVVASQTSYISLVLEAVPIVTDTTRAVYRNGQGNLIPINTSLLQSGKFVFYAWLQDMPLGIDPAKLLAATVSDPGKPLVIEQKETAPSFTQNLTAAWVGYTDDTGVVRPVIGADVRWEIDQQYFGRVNSMQFGTSDDNRIALGYGVQDDQADTRTNNGNLTGEGFPLLVNEYPLYNQSGIGTPFVDGFTWVTLFSPDAKAAGRIVAVATVNGEEIGKQILYKNFAPAAKLEITKTVNQDIVNLVGGTATVTWTVTVKNVGIGDAASVDLKDFLASGAGTSYTLGALPAGATADGDGFNISFPLTSGSTNTLTFTATVTEPGAYCNEGQIISYTDDCNTWSHVDIKAQACFTALESNVSIIKSLPQTTPRAWASH